jgi:transcriptional regulator with XRE-family HTH domain
MDTFWDRVYFHRKKQNLTQQQLADLCEIPLVTYNKWKKASSIPRANIVLTMAHSLDVSMEYLLTGDGSAETSGNYNLKNREIKKLVETLEANHPRFVSLLQAYLDGLTHSGK